MSCLLSSLKPSPVPRTKALVMISSIIEITRFDVTLTDANGDRCTVPIELTPTRRYLTQSTKRAILATGCLLTYGDELATDPDVINTVLQDIRRECLRHSDGGER